MVTIAIYITGDVHRPHDIKKLNTTWWPEQKKLTKDDYLIVCGDMGLVWNGGREDRYWQRWFEEKPFTTLFVDGNHENHSLLTSAFSVEHWNGGHVHRICPHVLHLMRGQIYIIDGLKVFAMGGAASHDKWARKEGRDWWPEEMPSNEEYEEAIKNLEANDWKVDLVVSHCAADSVQSELQPWYEHDKLTNFFEAVIKDRLQYKMWCFGHYHYDKQVDDKHYCLYQDVKQIHI